MKRSRDGSIIGRREFLKRGMLAGVGVSILPLAGAASASIEAAAPRVRRYSTLGRTGLKISDISFGASRLTAGNEDLVRHAFDCGVNYFDSADTYTDGESETTIGNALKGKRDKVFLTSKTMAGADDSRASMMTALEGSLRRLQTDHVDVYFNHAVNNPARLKNPEWYEFVTQAKSQGKIRFTGMSGHAGNLAECLDYAIDSGHFDVILCAHNFGQDPSFMQRFTRNFDMVARQPELPRLMKKANEHGVGVVVMKTLMGARLNDMRPVRIGRRDLLAGGVSMGAVQSQRQRADRFDDEPADDRRIPGRVGRARDRGRRPAALESLRESQRRFAVPSRVQRMRERMPLRRADRRRDAHADVRARLPRHPPGAERIRDAPGQRGGVSHLRREAVRGRVSARDRDRSAARTDASVARVAA